jgi:hypothetical protein
MAGGTTGPVPKRSDQRRRRNKDDIETETAPGTQDVEIPEASEDWTKAASDWYESLAKSGQCHWYEPSDWAQAWILAEMLDRVLCSTKPNAMMFNSWLAGASELLTTEGARRRMRIELAKAGVEDPEKDAAVSDLEAFRNRLAK